MEPTLQQVIDFVREISGDVKSVITEETRLEADLGITAGDGVELLEEAEKRFGVSFVTEERSFKETFGLRDNEYLFTAEGLDLFGVDWVVEEGAAGGGKGFDGWGVVAGVGGLVDKKLKHIKNAA